MRRVFAKCLNDCVVIGNINDLHLLDLEGHDLANSRQGQRLECTRYGHFAIADFLRKHLRGELLFVEFVAQFEDLDVVKKFDDFFVRAIPEGAQKSRSEKFPAAFATIEINVKQISSIELNFDPRSAIWNDSKTVEHLAVYVHRRFERNTRGTMQLAYDDALGPVDHECALLCHQRDFTHVNFFFFRPLLLTKLESYVQWRAVSLAFALRFERL